MEQAITETLPHREVEVRVKALIDEKIAPVVAALNDFGKLFTETSCQGFPPDGPGIVAFRYGDDWEETTIFCLWLQDELRQRCEEGAAVSLCCERHFHMRGRFDVNWSAVDRVTGELRAMASKFTSSTLRDALAYYTQGND